MKVSKYYDYIKSLLKKCLVEMYSLSILFFFIEVNKVIKK